MKPEHDQSQMWIHLILRNNNLKIWNSSLKRKSSSKEMCFVFVLKLSVTHNTCVTMKIHRGKELWPKKS